MRLFIGIEFPDDILRKLSEIQTTLRRCTSSGRFPHKQNMHLTLQFLGEVPEQEIANMVAALHQVAGQTAPFSLALGDTGVFGRHNPYRVIWLGLTGEVHLLRQLQTSVATSMARLGFMCEHNLYQPHITLGRDVACLEHDLQAWSGKQNISMAFTVHHFALLSSILQGGKRRYQSVERFQLTYNKEKKEFSQV